MYDVHQVVDLGALPDARLAHGRTIHGRVRPELHVVLDDDGSDLRDLLVRAVPAAGKPRPSLPTTAPFCRTTRFPSVTRSRIDELECTTQSLANLRAGTDRRRLGR